MAFSFDFHIPAREMASIDKMGWHYGGDFPENLANECGGTHIGMYLAWITEHGMIGEMHRNEAQEEIQKVLKREWTGRDFLIEVCDEVFWKEDLSEIGQQFTSAYYGEKGYYQDYKNLLPIGVNFYEFEDSWGNYERVRRVINARYEAWKSRQNRWWLKWLKW